MPRRNLLEVKSWHEEAPELVCPLCSRPIPRSQRDAHHLVPKSKGGRETQFLHRICHRHIHAHFTEQELATRYSTIAALLQEPEISKFVTWVRKKSPEFYHAARTSRRLR